MFHYLHYIAHWSKSNHNYNPFDNDRFKLRCPVTSLDARLDMTAGNFWSQGVTAFFNVRVMHVNFKSYQGKATCISSEQKEEKKWKYNRKCWTLNWSHSLPQLLGIVVKYCCYFPFYIKEILLEVNFKDLLRFLIV